MTEKIDITKEYKSVISRNDLLTIMWVLNCIIVTYFVLAMNLTQQRIVDNLKADIYMADFSSVPMNPWNRYFIVFASMVIITFCMHINNHVKVAEKNKVLYYSIELISVFVIMNAIEMAYSGLVLLVIADLIYYVKNQYYRIAIIVMTAVLYLLLNFYFLASIMPLTSFSIWVSFYDYKLEQWLKAMKYVLEVSNITVFMVYLLVLWINGQREKMKIEELNHQMMLANEQLRAYAIQQEAIGETKERNRLAREIHDTLGHVLTGISVGTEAAVVLVDIDAQKAKEQMNNIGDMARKGLQDVRRSVRKLKPDALEKGNLDQAIQQMIQDITRGTNVHIYYVSEEKEWQCREDEEETIYRTIQESITNSIRHGKATEIWIHVKKNENVLSIMIKDNGEGCQDIVEGFGLRHIRERIQMLGGQVDFESMGGFYTIVKLPIRVKEG